MTTIFDLFIFFFKTLLPIIGLNESATKLDITTAEAKVIAVWVNNTPVIPLTKISGVAEGSGTLIKALRLGLNPATIRGISRFAGLPGLAVSTAMTAYDQYQKYKDGE